MKNRIRIYLIVLFYNYILTTISIYGHTVIQVINDKNEFLNNVIVYDNKKILGYTDAFGIFEIKGQKELLNICFYLTGYNDTCINLFNKHKDTLIIKLTEKITQTAEVIVSSHSKKPIQISTKMMGTILLQTDSLRRLPSLTGETDAYTLLKLTPGITKTDFSMGLNVRGGYSDQNMILLDDGVIYNPTHLGGFLSIFNPLVVDNVTLVKSGLPVEYGGRTSSLLAFETNKTLPVKTQIEGNVGLMYSNLFCKTSIGENSYFQLAARKSYLETILKPILNKLLISENHKYYKNSTYQFYDFIASSGFTLSSFDKLYVTFYQGNDNFNLLKTSFDLSYKLSMSNYLLSMRWNHYFNTRHISKTIFYHSNNIFNMFFGQNDFYFQLFSGNLETSLKHEHILFLNNIRLKTGIQFLRQNIIPNKSNIELNYLKADLGTHNNFKLYTTSGYLSSEIDISNKIQVLTGFRYNVYAHIGPYNQFIRDFTEKIIDTVFYKKNSIVKCYQNPEFNLALKYFYKPKSFFHITFTHNVQYIQQVSVSSVSLPTDFWMPASLLLPPQQSIQYSSGITHPITNHINFSFEIFFKNLQNITEFKKGILNAISRVSMEENILLGNGRMYGMEILLSKDLKNLSGWISYTLSKSERIFHEINQAKPFPSKYDRRHDITTTLTYHLNSNWHVSAIFIYATGLAVTLPSGRYIVRENIVNQYVQYNSFRMPSYHRLDISISKTFQKRNNFEQEIIFSFYNIYNRLNPYFMYFHVEGELQQYKLKISPQFVSFFPIMPSISYRFKF